MSSEVVAKLREWRVNPVQMVRDLFGVEPDGWQREALEAFVENHRGALKACKGPGKTGLLAWLGWNFLLTRPHPKVVCTSITQDNLKDGLWTEMAKWRSKSALLKEMFDQTSSRIFAKEAPDTWFASARAWAKDSDPSQQANAMAGIHGDYVLMLLDEVGDYPEGVFVAAEAALSTGVETKLWCAGNPTRTDGPLYRVCTIDRARWWVKEITGDPDDPMRAPRISKEWARQQIETWGRDNPWVMVNVFGKFPPAQADKLVGPEEASQAIRRVIPEGEFVHEARVMGVDVARYGDDQSVILMRQGKVCFRPRLYRNLDLMEVADQVVQAIIDWKPDRVFIDAGGLGGGVCDRVRQLGYDVTGIEFGSGAMDRTRYENRRAEMWWKMADWVKNGGSLPNIPELVAGLCAPTYGFSKNSRMVLASKDEMKKKGMPSPDIADALAMTFALPVLPSLGRTPLENRMRSGVDSRCVHTDYDPMSVESLEGPRWLGVGGG